MRTYHAVEIITDDGLGNPVGYSNTAIGLASDGHFYLINGRPGLDGSKTIAGDTARTVWYPDLLVEDSSAFSPSRVADIIDAGGLESATPFHFSMPNTAGLAETLRANGVHLARCRAIYYFVTSSDGLTFTFYRRSTGVIEEQPFSETVLKLNCIDNSKDIFGSLPVSGLNSNAYPDAAPSDKDKQIPIVIGRVAYSPLVNVNSAGAHTSLTLIDGEEGITCAAKDSNASEKWIDLFTEGKSFQVNTPDLVGRFLTVVAGGAEQSIKIVSNIATDIADQTTRVVLEDAWTGSLVEWAGTGFTVWYFQVRQYSADFLSSEKPVSEFIKNGAGQVALYSNDSDTKWFTDISELRTVSSLSGIKTYGRPGVEAIVKRLDGDGTISVYTPIRPTDIILQENQLSQPWSGPAVGLSQPDLFDGDQTSGYLHELDPDPITFNELTFDIKFPIGKTKKSFDEIYVLMDARHRAPLGGPTYSSIKLTAYGIDLHGRLTSAIFSNTFVYDPAGVDPYVTADWTRVDTIPSVYYNESDASPDRFFSKKSLLNISAAIDSLTKVTIYPTIRLEVFLTCLEPVEVEIFEIGFVGKKAISLTNDTLFHSLKGETFGSEWRSADFPTVARRTPGDPQLNIADAIEGLIRKYDYNHPVWVRKTYKVGERVRNAVDNGFIYICTVAGASGATEPAFPTTLGATVADGAVTWKAIDTIKINSDSFDVLAAQRPWPVGRTLIDKKPSVDYYKELFRCGFIHGHIDNQGRVKVRAWREYTTPVIAFSSEPGGNILEGTLKGQMKPTGMRRVYNDFLIRYDWNYASKSYNRQLFVTHADEPEFPGINETIIPGVSLGSFQVFRLSDGVGGYVFHFITAAEHGLSSGGYASLEGNTGGFDIAPLKVSVENTFEFYVTGFWTASGFSTSGTLRSHTDTRIRWKTFVGGIANYALAKLLWEQAHDGYLETKSIQKLPSELEGCMWFIDPEVKDPAGNVIWDGDLLPGDDHPAVYYLQNLVEWDTRQKYLSPPFEVPKDITTLGLETGMCASLLEAKLTSGRTDIGWIHEITDLQAEGKKPERLRIVLLMNPLALVTMDFIDENGADAADIIDENGATAGDFIDEN